MATRHVSLQKQTQLQLQLYLWFFFLSFSLPLSLPLFLALHSPLSCHFIFPNYSFSPSFLTILRGVQCTKYHNGNWANRFKKFCRIHCKMRGWGGKYPRETHHRHHRHLLLLNLVVHEHTHTQIQQAVRFSNPPPLHPQMTRGNSLQLQQSCHIHGLAMEAGRKLYRLPPFSRIHKIFPGCWRKHWVF